MAVPSNFDESNTVLNRPSDMSADECGPLCVCVTNYEDETPVVISCWKLTQKELDEINKTGRVWLHIYGYTMPPAAVSGTNPFKKQS